jgi:hypothetical protein
LVVVAGNDGVGGSASRSSDKAAEAQSNNLAAGNSLAAVSVFLRWKEYQWRD